MMMALPFISAGGAPSEFTRYSARLRISLRMASERATLRLGPPVETRNLHFGQPQPDHGIAGS
jgi:hypothetical protein